MRIAVAGGTGAVGRLVVAAARTVGHEPVVISRSAGVDLVTGAGLRAALEGADAVVDVSGPPSLAAAASRRFFAAATRNLLAAGRSAGIRHHVALSIVGAARVDAGYYTGKALQERLVTDSAGGWSLLRTTQFHEFARQVLSRGPVAGVVLAPRFRSQPIAAAEVADALVAIAAGAPGGVLPELAGPRPERMPDLVRRLARASGSRAPVLAVPLPGRIGRAMRDGSLLPPVDAVLGVQTFDEWLASAATGGGVAV